MKKFIFTIVIIIIVLIALLGFGYLFAPKILSYILSKDVGTKVKIEDISFKRNEFNIKNLKIYNPPKSRTKEAFTTKTLDIKTTLKQLFAKKLIIDKIILDDIFVNIEFYNKQGTKNNWSEIINKNPAKKKSEKEWLIKSLILRNLKVRVVNLDGTVKDYPKLNEIKLQNLSEESGFPISEIESAILQAVIKSIFSTHGLQELIKTVNPMKMIPNIFGYSFVGKQDQNHLQSPVIEKEIAKLEEN